MNFETTPAQGYLRIVATGEASLTSLKEVIDYAKAASEAAGMNRIAIDTRGMEGGLQAMDRFFAGVYAADAWRPPLRVMMLDHASRINKFGENTAVNRGAQLLVTASAEKGMAWLLGK